MKTEYTDEVAEELSTIIFALEENFNMYGNNKLVLIIEPIDGKFNCMVQRLEVSENDEAELIDNIVPYLDKLKKEYSPDVIQDYFYDIYGSQVYARTHSQISSEKIAEELINKISNKAYKPKLG